MNAPSVGFNNKIFGLRFCQRELTLALKVSQCRKKCERSSTSSLQKSKMRRWFRSARGHRHSSRSLLSNVLADAGASQGQEIMLTQCLKNRRKDTNR